MSKVAVETMSQGASPARAGARRDMARSCHLTPKPPRLGADDSSCPAGRSWQLRVSGEEIER